MSEEKRLGSFLPSYYDEEYFEKGTKSNYNGYPREAYLPICRKLRIGIAEQLALKGQETILVLGCAKAFLVEAFLEHLYNAYGQDISKYALKNATPYVKHLLTQSSVTHLPYRNKVFDLVYASDVLEHLEKAYESQILLECFRILVPGGKILIAHPCGGEETRKIEEAEGSHQTIEPTEWWNEQLIQTGFQVLNYYNAFFRTYVFISRKPE